MTRWRALQNLLSSNTPASPEQYVEPRHRCSSTVAQLLTDNPTVHRKVLLVGPRGGGKSPELRAIAKNIEDTFNIVSIDLDASGITAASVSAFDLLFICGLGLLRGIADKKQQESLFAELKAAYTAGDTGDLGDLIGALGGLAEFTTAASGAATALGTIATAAGANISNEAGIVAAALGIGATVLTGLKLRSKPAGVVHESSPMGRNLQEVCKRIVRAYRAGVERPVCVLVDGLEKMNGQAGERFREMFEHTRILADAQWTMVIAAPPCTLAETNALQGFLAQPVWGFGTEDLDGLLLILQVRFTQVGLSPEKDADVKALNSIVQMSGGLPRHAIWIAFEAVSRVLSGDLTEPPPSPKELAGTFEERLLARRAETQKRLKMANTVPEAMFLGSAEAAEGIQKVGEALGMGMNEEDLDTLLRVLDSGVLPKDSSAARLFGDGRILVLPPEAGQMAPQFVVHPLLLGTVRTWKGKRKALGSSGKGND